MSKGEQEFHKLRILNPNSPYGNTYGISIPFSIAKYFSGCYFSISKKNNSIILESGCNHD